MPLKYLYGRPQAVQITGAIHGGLFVLYVLAIFRAARFGKWSWFRILEAFIASLLPFGPFFIDYKYRNEASNKAPDHGTDSTRGHSSER